MSRNTYRQIKIQFLTPLLLLIAGFSYATAPTTSNFSLSIDEDQTLTIIDSDFPFSDTDNDALGGIRVLTLPDAGTLQHNLVNVTANQVITLADLQAGNFKFIPDPNENGTPYATFTFTVIDDAATPEESTSAILTINVNPVGDAPTAQNNTLSVDEDNTLIINTSDFNFGDIDGDNFDKILVTTTVGLGTLNNDGTALNNGDEVSVTSINSGLLTFTPAPNANGEGYTSFDFRVYDDAGDNSAIYTMTIDVNSINDIPTSTDNTVTILEDGIKTFSLSDFTFNDADGDGLSSIRVSGLNITGSFQLSGSDVAENQIITVAEISNLIFTPEPDGNGNNYTSFEFEVNDGTTYSVSTYLFTINVTPVDDPPTIDPISDPADILEDAGQQQITVTGITPGGGETALTTSNISVSSSNTVLISNPVVSSYNSGNGEAVISYTPAADQFGSSLLTVTVDDGNTSVSEDFTVGVLPVNDEPTVNAVLNQTTSEDTPITVDIDGITAGAANESAQFLTITATSSNTSIVPDAAVNYSQGSDIATLTFTPVLNAIGTVTISLKVKDDGGVVNAGSDDEINLTFELQVIENNDPPTLADIVSPDPIIEDAGQQSIGLSGIGDGDPELTQNLTISAVSDNTFLVETITPIYTQGSSTATLSYTPKPDAFGSANVEVTVSDGDQSVTKSFTIVVNPVNDPPAIDPVGTVADIDEDASTVTIILSGISPGPFETSQTVSVTAESSNTSIIPHPTANYEGGTDTWSISYAPMPDQFGSADITITVTDDDANQKNTTTTFTQVVNPINDPPTLNPVSDLNINEDAGIQNVVFDGISDDGTVPKNLTVTASSSNTDIISNSNISINYTSPNSGGSLDFQANPDKYGSVTITIQVTDKEGLPTTQDFLVNITNINDAPTLDDIPIPSAVLEDATENTITLTGISSGPGESEPLIASISTMNPSLFSDLSVTLNGDGTGILAYTPAANANGITTVTVHLDDQLGLNNIIEKSVDITILAVNDIPSFDIPAIEAISENSGIQNVPSFATNIDDGDPEIQSLSFSTTLNAPTGNISFVIPPTIDPLSGDLTYEISSNTNGNITVDVTLLDNGGTSNGGINQITKSFSIIVTAINNPPSFSLNGNPPSINEDAGPITENAFAINIDDGDPELSQDLEFDISLVSGSLTFNSFPSIDPLSGDLTYTVSDNSNGTATFDVFLRETASSKVSATEQFTITVNALNDPPVGGDGAITINEDETYIFQSTDFTFSDIDNHAFEGIQITLLPLNGDLLYNGSPVMLGTIYPDITQLAYTPATNESGSPYTTFGFKVRDESGDLSDASYTLTINVTAISDDPTGASSSVNTAEDTNYSFTVDNFPFSDSDNDAFNGIEILSNVSKGSLLENSTLISSFPATVNDVTQLVYQPLAGENGTPYTSFTFDVIDATNATSSSDANSPYTLSINVGAVNDPPTGSDENISIREDAIYTFSTSDFTFNDPDGHTFAGIQITQIENTGALRYNGADVIALTNYPDVTLLTYTPPSNQNGNALANFKFKVIDNSAELNISTASYTMTIDVTAVNDAPIFTITEDPPEINEDAGAQTVPGFVSSIDDGDAEIIQNLNFGLSYTLPPTLTFAVNPSIDVSTGNLTYTPSDNAYGSVMINVILNDDGGTANGGANQSSLQQFNLVINPINDAPTLNDVTDSYTVNEDASTFSINLDGISAGPNESQSLTITARSDNQLIIPDPSVNYTSPNTSAQLSATPVANANGTVEITVTVSDGQTNNSTTTKTFNITVNSVNDPPTLNVIDDPAPINEDATTQTVNLEGITAGPNETQSLSVTATSDNQALISNGSLEVIYTSPNSIGSINYTPEPNSSGIANITVEVVDDSPANNSITRNFTVEVLAVNDPPTLANLPSAPIQINEDAASQNLTLTGISAGGGENQTLTISAISDKPSIIPHPSIGNLIDGEAILTYQPAANQFGLVTITVTVDDGQALNNSISKSFQVNVQSINDLPTLDAITGSPFNIDEDASQQEIILSGITPGGGETQTLNIYAISSDETLIANPNITYTQGSTTATLTYLPLADQSGSVDIDVFVDDLSSINNLVSRSFTVNVNAVNDPPTINDIVSPGDILEDASQQTVALSGITAGGGEIQTVIVTAAEVGGQDLIDNITINYSGNNNGSLLFTLHPNANGSTTIEVTVNDQQATNNTTTKSFDINVLKVNDLPTLDPIASPYVINEDAGPQTITLTGISPGPNESEQTVTITAVSDNTELVPNPSITNLTADSRNLSFTPSTNNNGTANITVTVNDGQASDNLVTRSFAVNVNPQNDKPTFDIQSSVNITESAGPQSISSFATNIDDGDPELSQTLTFSLDISGSLSFESPPTISPANGTLTFEVSENSNGQAVVNVTLSDNGTPPMASDVQTFTINVLPVDGEPSFTLSGDPPASVEDAGLVNISNFVTDIDDGDPELDQSATLNFILNILSGDITYSTPPDINTTDGTLSYEAAPNSFGTSFISVVLSDGNKSSSTSFFTLTINPVNDAPVGSNETVTTDEDIQYTFQSSDFTYSDLESNPFNGIQIVTLESAGDLEYNGLDVTLNQICPDVSRLVFKPATNANGVSYASFDFKLRDSQGKLSDTYTMTINVNPVDDNPTSANSEVNTDENISYQFTSTDFTFEDPDGDSFNGIRIFSLETRGELKYDGKNVKVGDIVTNFSLLIFTPVPDESGSPYATFEFEVRDSKGDFSPEYTMSIIVGPVNDRPTGSNESISMLEDETYTFSSGNFTFNDVDGHSFDGIRIESIETTGDLEYNGTDVSAQSLCPDLGLLTFQPNTNANGSPYATFTFKVKDNSTSFNLSSATYTMTINVTAVNDAPLFTISENPPAINEDAGLQTISGFATSISSGDPEASQVLQFNTPNPGPSTGNLSFTSGPSISNTGTLTYRAAANTSGTATFSVTLSDDGGTSNGGINISMAKNFTITVNSVNDPPTINAISDLIINEDANQQNINLSNITAGPLESQTISITSQSSNTALIPTPNISYTSPNSTGSLTFAPVPDKSGQATITVTVNDGGSNFNTVQETFIVTVNPVNDPPTINPVPDQGPITENAGQQIINLDGISAGGGENQNVLLSASSSNTALIPIPDLTYIGGSTAQLAYVPVPDESGESTITVTVDDQNGETTQITFKITVSPVNDPPTLNPISNPSPILEDAPEQEITLTGISAGTNENQNLSFIIESSNSNLLTISPIAYTQGSSSAALKYTPKPNQFGSTIITITVDDGALIDNQVSRQFTVQVNPVADTPSVTDASTDQNSQTNSGLIVSRNSNDGAEVTYFKITNIQNGTLYLQDGITQIINGEFITYEQGNQGLRFTPGSNINGSFNVQASLEDADSGLGGSIVTANIFINSIPTTNFPFSLLETNEDSDDLNFYLPQYFDDEEDLDMDLIFTVNNTNTTVVNAEITNQTLTIGFVENQSGTAFITIRCTDTQGAFVEHELELRVKAVNDSPYFESNPVLEATEDEFYEYQIVTSDVEDNNRNIEILTKPIWLSLTDNGDGTARASGTPTNDDLGSTEIQIRVYETISGLDSIQTFNLTVLNVNDTPRIVSQPILSIEENQRYEYVIEIEDPDPNDSYQLTEDPTTRPNWLIFNPTNGTLVGVPPVGSAGIYRNIKIIVWDEAGAADEQVFDIQVNSPNTPPTIIGGFDPTVKEDSILTFSTEDFKTRVQDPDEGDSLVAIIITELPEFGDLKLNGVLVNENDTIYLSEINTLEYLPAENDHGDVNIYWQAFDGKTASILPGVISVEITSVDDPPVIINLEESSLLYAFGDTELQITQTAEVLEVDFRRIVSATFSIVSNYNDQEDSLYIDEFVGISSNWNDTTGVLSVSGFKSDTLYTQIVRSLKYVNQKRFAPDINVRTIELIVFDGDFESEPVLRYITFEDTFVPPEIPTAFTPNEDTANDLWEIENMESHEDAIVRIYSREGYKIYESIGLYQPWDGKYNGDYVKSGVYYFTLEIPKFERKYSGTITVLR